MQIAKAVSLRWFWDRRRIEWVIGTLITAAAVYLHWVNFRSAGALWRDEAGVVRIATLPSAFEMWSDLGHESCPVLFPALTRFWSFIVSGNDVALRVFGFIIGLLILGAVWLNGWFFHRSAPLVALGLLAVNPSVVRWGDSLRAYGLASMLMLVTLAMIWRFARSPSLKRWLVAALMAVISVQCLFQNSFLLLAVCAAAAAVSVRRHNFKNALAAPAIGVPAAISLLPYRAVIHEVQDWSVLSQIGFLPALIWTNLSDAMSPNIFWLRWFWIALAVAAIARCVKKVRLMPDELEEDTNSAAFFAGTALIAGLIAFFIFLRIVKMPTQVWYFLPLTTFAAVCIDGALANWPARWRFWRCAFAILALLCLPGARELVVYRQTNMDLIASVLRERANAQDLIIVHPWTFGVSFDRQYSGPTPWTTVPPLADHRFHRYDLFKAKMILENPVQPVCDQIAATLRARNYVWLVGDIPLSQTPPPQIQPGPNNPWGWLDDPYSDVWGAQVGYFVATHATQGEVVPIHSPNPVSPLENVRLVAVAGWQESFAVPTSGPGDKASTGK
jgi:Dolichyl-phosphate-mannose-protein mannosyltransferase